MDFKSQLTDSADAVEQELKTVLPKVGEGPEGRLHEAIRYAALAAGKRLRPAITLASASLFEVPPVQAVRAAAAIECVHCYSLIHDDLPCMDDDDLRRGQPSAHKQFDEATALLAGDALLTFAFELLSDPLAIPNAIVRCELVTVLARAAGPRGMVAGQMLDLAGETTRLNESQTVRMQRLKTGEMIACAAVAGAILGRANRQRRHALEMYARDLGLAFQITDDLLDVTGTREETGKGVGKDADRGKATFVALLGIEAAGERAGMLARQAAQHLDIFGERAKFLIQLCDYVITRRH